LVGRGSRITSFSPAWLHSKTLSQFKKEEEEEERKEKEIITVFRRSMTELPVIMKNLCIIIGVLAMWISTFVKQ
jgi:hypothetical protein